MNEVPRFVYDAFYPRGWEERQTNDVAALLDAAGASVWLAHRGNAVIGFIGLRIHPEDQMGEIHILAVDPDHQKAGVGRMLIDFAEKHIRDEGMKIVMVETTGDSGHEPARRAYEASGYERWPVVRYFKRLR
jgi:GNAT superfamily N-acetyltransferase